MGRSVGQPSRRSRPRRKPAAVRMPKSERVSPHTASCSWRFLLYRTLRKSFTERSENRSDRAFRFGHADAKAARADPFTITVFPADSYGILFFADAEIRCI